jgi:hypothetical protein
VEELDPQAGLSQRGNDLAEAVVPFEIFSVFTSAVGSAYEPWMSKESGSSRSQ